MKPSAFAPVLFTAVCVALSGCFRGDTNVKSGDRTQVLHRGIGAELTDLDPHLATETSYYTVLSALLEGLVAEDPSDLRPVPAVAERWDVSADGLNYTFYLRPDARWSNGEPVTASDFVGSWKRILTPSFAAPRASLLYLIQGAEAFNRGDGDFSQVGISAPEPRILKVALEHPAPWFLTVLSSPAWLPVPIAALDRYGATADRQKPWAVPERWVGNGPFVLKSWVRGQEIVVERSPTYWDREHVRLAAIDFHLFESIDAEERAFRAGQIHLTETIPTAKIDAYRRDAPALLRIDPLLGTYFLRVNVRRPALSDRRVRMALALAIDRASLTEKVLRGGQRPAYSFVPQGLAGYAPELVQRGQIDDARRLLEEAGHPGGSGLPSIEVLYNTSESHREIALALQEMWRRDLGVQVTLVNQELKSTEEARQSGAYDLLLSSWIADYEDPSAFLEMWRNDSSENFTGWSSGDYDSLLFQGDRETDPAARNANYEKAEHLLLEAAPIIPLYHYTHVFLIRPSVHGWMPTWLDHHPYKNVWLQN